MDRPIRRKDRQISAEEAVRILEKAEFGTLSMTEADGTPYAVPLSFVWMDGCVWFHCALEGRKIETLRTCPAVCFTCVSGVQAVYKNDFSTFYESVMVFGKAEPAPEQDRHRALTALCMKYLPEYSAEIGPRIAASDRRTAVYRIVPTRITGKAKR